MPKPYIFYTSCVNTEGKYVRDMLDDPRYREITRETFLKHVDYQDCLKEIESDLGYGNWLHMKSDWAVSYFSSWFKGVPCYGFVWSSIEHIFVNYIEIDSMGDIIKRPVFHPCRMCGNNKVKVLRGGKAIPHNDEDEYFPVYVCSSCGTILTKRN